MDSSKNQDAAARLWTPETLTVDGLKTHFLRAGKGPRLYLLHGGLIDKASISWELLVPKLRDRYELIAPDLPGYGRTQAPRGTPTVSYYAKWLSHFLAETGSTRPATLVGLSFGGMVALATALGHRELVGRLVLVATGGLSPKGPGPVPFLVTRNSAFFQALMRWSGRKERAFHNMVRLMFRSPDAVSPKLLANLKRELDRGLALETSARFVKAEWTRKGVRTDFSSLVENITVPTLLVHSPHDLFCPFHAAVSAAEKLPNGRLEVISDAGHWIPRERPDKLAGLITRFMDDTGNDTRDAPV